MTQDNLLQSDQTQSDLQKNYLEELVGENKKFKSTEDLAKGKYEADQYVEHLKRQLDEMRTDYSKLRDDYNARAKLEELIDQMEVRRQQQNLPHEPPKQVVQQPSLDPEQIKLIAASTFQEQESLKQQKQNFDLVKSKLQERYGSNYATALKEQVNNLGLTEDFVNDMARKHPQALLRTLGMDAPVQQQMFQSPPRSETRSDNFKPVNQKRTWSYYQDLKKKDPKAYFDPKTQVQMHQDAMTLGEDFKDGDYNA